MLIDSCASGGRRDDLETIRRAVPLLRSDPENNAEAYQCHDYGCGLWLQILYARNYEKCVNYNFRSTIAPFLQCNWDVRKDDFDLEGAKEWREVADSCFGDRNPTAPKCRVHNLQEGCEGGFFQVTGRPLLDRSTVPVSSDTNSPTVPGPPDSRTYPMVEGGVEWN